MYTHEFCCNSDFSLFFPDGGRFLAWFHSSEKQFETKHFRVFKYPIIYAASITPFSTGHYGHAPGEFED
jgi:hypothetical protein